MKTRSKGSDGTGSAREDTTKESDRMVSRREDGEWANKKVGGSRASGLHATQAEANEAAGRMLKNEGGGERTTQGERGRIVSKDTIPPGNDPFPPRDREH